MGHGNALVVARGTPPPTEASGLQVPPGGYDLALRFQVYGFVASPSLD